VPVTQFRRNSRMALLALTVVAALVSRAPRAAAARQRQNGKSSLDQAQLQQQRNMRYRPPAWLDDTALLQSSASVTGTQAIETPAAAATNGRYWRPHSQTNRSTSNCSGQRNPRSATAPAVMLRACSDGMASLGSVGSHRRCRETTPPVLPSIADSCGNRSAGGTMLDPGGHGASRSVHSSN